MEDKIYWVAVNLVKGIGAVRLRALLDYFGDLKTAWNAPADALMQAGLSEKVAARLVEVRSTKDLQKMAEWIEKHDIQVFTWNDENYPAILKEIDQPPPVLYVRGKILPEDNRAAAVVGTRKVTAYGRQVTEEIIHHLVQNGFTVVSGLARGVDGIAHQAALQDGGRTLAVLGCGVEQVYPAEHMKLAEQIIGSGALISDYAPGTKPDAANFPPRNRIISGLSQVTIVIEAGETSGALITATFAVEQGRDVMAVPGSIYAPQCKGTNRLISQGAFPYTGPASLENLLNLSPKKRQSAQQKVKPENEIEGGLVQVMGTSQSMHIDELVAASGLGIEKISAALTMMELRGLVNHEGGMVYSLREPGELYVTEPDE
jgi:DNA processing protein